MNIMESGVCSVVHGGLVLDATLSDTTESRLVLYQLVTVILKAVFVET